MPSTFSLLLHRSLRFLFLGLVLLAAAPSWAQGGDIDKSLDQIRQQLTTAQRLLRDPESLDDEHLQAMRADALAAQAKADEIAASLTPQQNGIQARVAELGTPAPGTKEAPDVATQRSLLAKNAAEVDAQIKLARLLAVESAQLAGQLYTLRRSEFQARLGTRAHSILGKTFWTDLATDLPGDGRKFAAFGKQVADGARGTPLLVWILTPVLVALIVFALRWVRRRLMNWLTTRAPAGRLRRSFHALLVVLQTTLTTGAISIGVYSVLTWNGQLDEETTGMLASLSGSLWFFGFMFGLLHALICARRPSWRLVPLPDPVAQTVAWLPTTLTLVSLVTFLAERVAVLANASLSTTVAINCLVALATGLTVVLALGRGERAWRRELAKDDHPHRPIALAIVAGLNWLVLLVAVVCLLVGYVAFGSFAIRQVVWAAIVLGAAYLLAALVDDMLMAWLAPTPRAPDPVAEATADEPPRQRSFAQVAVLASGLLRVAILMVALMLLLAPFGEGPSDLLRRSSQFGKGLSIGEVKLQPTTVLLALTVLVVGLGVVSLLRRWLANRYLPTTSLDPGMRSSATSLFGYAGVVVSISLAMSAMGIGLERIAWVASALSVGIGFGLQAVVQNFVSGLILLAERPVKVGDWVSLSGVEGDIRRINVRATEIQMGDRSTVIVPNSEFITKIVRNVTLANPLGLVQLKLPVPLGSDEERVKSLLLAAFDANPDVQETPGPSVLLDGIDNGQLMFNATGFANSPRITARVKSELLFDMLKRLREAGIALSKPPTMLLGNPPPALPPV